MYNHISLDCDTWCSWTICLWCSQTGTLPSRLFWSIMLLSPFCGLYFLRCNIPYDMCYKLQDPHPLPYLAEKISKNYDISLEVVSSILSAYTLIYFLLLSLTSNCLSILCIVLYFQQFLYRSYRYWFFSTVSYPFLFSIRAILMKMLPCCKVEIKPAGQQDSCVVTRSNFNHL